MAPRAERPNMDAYGVPSDLDGVLPWAWAQQRLVATRNYWVVTVDPAGRPHAMPVWGRWDESTDRFWFSCAPSALKARNIENNPQVVVAGDDTVEVVSVEGTATRQAARLDVARLIASKYEPDPDLCDQMAGFMADQALFEVVPSRAFGIIERADEFAARATRWTFG